MRHHVRVRLDLLEQAAVPRAARRSACARRSGRGRATSAASGDASSGSRANNLVVGERDAAFDDQDVDQRQVVPLADLEIVEVVRRRDLHRAGALLRIGIFVGDDRDPAADQRQDDVLADQVLVALVVGMHRDGGIAQHGLGPRGGDDDESMDRLDERLAFERIAQMPEAGP